MIPGTKKRYSKASRASEERSANPIDVHVGSRVRLRRNMLGLSQEKLGEAIGLTVQQVQKYERGVSRIGASRLHDLSRVLDVPISFFFDDIDPVPTPVPAEFSEPAAEAFEPDPLRISETVDLARAYCRIDDPAVRRRLFELARVLAIGAEPLPLQEQQVRVESQEQQRLEQIGRRPGQPDDEAAAGAAFAAAAAALLNAVNDTITEMRRGREETGLLLDRLEAQFVASHG